MSMLDAEAMAKLSDTVFGEEPTPSNSLTVDATTGDVQEITTEVETKSEDVKQNVSVEEAGSTPTKDVKLEVQESDDGAPVQKGHKVPYNRFKNVLEARNRFRGEIDGYKSEISSLNEKLAALEQSRAKEPASPQNVPTEQSWLDSYLSEPEQEAPAWQNQYDGLHDRLYKFEVAQEQQKLQVEMQEINKQFPSVPENLLLKAVINNPDVDLHTFAEDYSAYVGSIEESAIARYLEKSPAPAVTSAPRPRTMPSQGASSVTAPDQKVSTLRQASDALRKALKKS